jgi:excisionase family DNA binding protein
MTRLLLTVDEAAEALGICRAMVYRLINAGELHTVKIGKARRISVEELQKYVERLSEEQNE